LVDLDDPQCTKDLDLGSALHRRRRAGRGFRG
jgi:hypothetical protein